MKRIIHRYTLLIVTFLVTSVSCNKDDLEVNPVNATEADYFKTEAEFNKAVIGVYARLTALYNHNGGTHLIPMYVLPGDDVTLTGSNPFEQFATLTSTNGVNNLYYQQIYQLVGRANIVLQKIAEENGVYKTAGLKNTHKGEALFLRGYAFFSLWNYYGKAPVTIERATTTDKLYPPESTNDELLNQAIADFQEAASLLPTSWPSSQRGRVTANSANGMLGKSLVFRASWKAAPADYTAAIAAFNKITGASLVPKFDDNFAFDTENNAESLFEFQASQPGFDNIWLPNEFDGAIGTMSAYWGYFYEGNTNSNNNINYLATDKLIAAFEPGDPRLALTYKPTSNSGKQFIKWSRRDENSNSGNGSINNPRILRLADVILLKAEAVLKSGGSKSEAIGLINQVRARARAMVPGGTAPADRNVAETNEATIMNWIMTERFVELAGEGQRWFDLRRWHKAGYITLNNAFFSPANVNELSFDATKHLLMPIPVNEIDRNPNIQQNPGY